LASHWASDEWAQVGAAAPSQKPLARERSMLTKAGTDARQTLAPD
jgi:hypothetical protein